MAAASIVVLPGSPEVAESIDVSVQGCDAGNYELYVDDELLERGAASDKFSFSHSAASYEVALANFGMCGRKVPDNFKAGDRISLTESLHRVKLRFL